MDYNLKQYRFLKVKKHFKDSKLLFFYHSSKVEANEWVLVEQDLKKVKLQYHKVLNGTTNKLFKHSIFRNFSSAVCGTFLFVIPTYNSTLINLKVLEKNFNPLFTLLFIKLNNKVYSISQIQELNVFSYRDTMLKFTCNLEKYSKLTYVFTNDNKKSK